MSADEGYVSDRKNDHDGCKAKKTQPNGQFDEMNDSQCVDDTCMSLDGNGGQRQG